MNKSKKLYLALTSLILTATLLAATTYAAIATSQTLTSSGSVTVSANIGLYSDSACRTAITSFNWGSVSPGGTSSQTVYVKNTGSGVSLTLNMTTSNWSPSSANGPMTITWDKEGTKLSPGQSTPAIITLSISPTIVDVTNFSVQISITGTQ